jgi:hypothetical protein
MVMELCGVLAGNATLYVRRMTDVYGIERTRLERAGESGFGGGNTPFFISQLPG